MRNGKKVIDMHNHSYTKAWLDYCAKRTQDPLYEWTGPSSGVFKVAGVIAGHVDKAGDYDVVARVADLDEHGIDTQIVTHTCPGVAEVPVKESIPWAKRINDTLAEFCQKYPGRFHFLATFPPENMDEALKEIDRAYKDLGAKGLQMYSNVNGELASSEKFYPIYERAAEYGLPVKIHPAFRPLTAEAMKQAKLPLQMYGFTLDTTMAVTAMIFQGLFEKLPKLKMVHSHLGGMTPYMMGRVDNAFHRFAKEWGIEIRRLPSETYKEHIYIDTLSLHVPAIRCASEFMGTDHLMFGTDYPHRASGTVADNLGILEKLGFSEAEKTKVLSENAAKLFKIK
jgi:aminocarboxymuconate-semialdehyde decarboxylase